MLTVPERGVVGLCLRYEAFLEAWCQGASNVGLNGCCG